MYPFKIVPVQDEKVSPSNPKFDLQFDIGGWTISHAVFINGLAELRDDLNKILGYQEISDQFSVSIKEAETITKFRRKNSRICDKCKFKNTDCDKCALICQSPLERDLFLALRQEDIIVQLQTRINRDGKSFGHTLQIDKERILTIPDFFIEGNGRKLCVYADGHTYHERTEYQALRDRSIDRELQNLGYTVLRYTGREIRSELENVVQNIKKYI